MTRFLLPALGAAGLALLATGGARAERAVPLPLPARDVAVTATPQTAVFAGGCFWGLEAVFEHVKGVRSVTAGYAGGAANTATYDQVSTETTGHAEAVKVVYDPHQVTFGQLLRVYFSIAHDPTQLNRQGPDTGTSYRSAIFPQTPEQRDAASAYIAQLGHSHAFRAPIVTRLENGNFYTAESYHQRFYDRNPSYPYIMMWDKPKVAAFKAAFPTLAK